MILVLIFDRTENNATNPDKTFITLLLKRKLSKAKATESLVCLWQNTFFSNVQEKKVTPLQNVFSGYSGFNK